MSDELLSVYEGENETLREAFFEIENFIGDAGNFELADDSSVDTSDVVKAVNAIIAFVNGLKLPATPPETWQRETASLIAEYYRREIGTLMHQAEHWAQHDKPLAVHHRLGTADAYFQIVTLAERFAKFNENPFAAMQASLGRPPINTPGTYPPSAELHRYRDPHFVVAELARLAAPKLSVVGES